MEISPGVKVKLLLILNKINNKIPDEVKIKNGLEKMLLMLHREHPTTSLILLKNELEEIICRAVTYKGQSTMRERWGIGYHVRADVAKRVEILLKEINPLPESIDEQEGVCLPPVLNTQQARKYFAKAIEAKYMERTATGYKWTFGGEHGKLARLGYFIKQVYPQPRPINALETYFGVKKLSSLITQAEYKPKRADVKQWRAEIDKLFQD